MKCPHCGAAKLVRGVREVPYTYKGESTKISRVKGDFCPACGEAVLDGAESARVSAAMLAFNKRVNAHFVDPSFIAKVRRKLALDQRQAGELFGGGVNAFSRYENGKTKPPLALVQLLKLLDRHPEHLDEIRLNEADIAAAVRWARSGASTTKASEALAGYSTKRKPGKAAQKQGKARRD